MFVGSVVGYMVFCFLRSLLFQCFMVSAATGLHNKMAEKVLRANILFYDSNPIGRITTRFSKDMVIIDQMLPTITVFVTQAILRAISVVITVSIINPYLLIVLFFGMLILINVTKKGIAPMIESQRFD